MQVLFKERPSAIHVQTPPFVCGLVVDLYCRLTGAKFVFEYHSAAFEPIWDWALPVQKYLARRAAANIVTNQHWAEVVETWGGRTIIMFDPYLDLPQGKPFDVGPGFNIAFINTFSFDEPVEVVVDAARSLPDVHFYITGEKSIKPPDFYSDIPANITFTGFLDPNQEYLGLLRGVDAVIVLTTRNYTLQLGGTEAVSMGKPLLTSDWPYLQELFFKGTVYVPNTAEGVREGVRNIQNNHETLSSEILVLRQESQALWDTRMQQLKQMVALE
jgi:glycosyltransferase involved in cell wall biosynthesis